MPSIFILLVLIAMGLSLASAFGKVPTWTAVFVLCVALLVGR